MLQLRRLSVVFAGIIVTSSLLLSSCSKSDSSPAAATPPPAATTPFWSPSAYSGSVYSFAVAGNGNWFIGSDGGLIVSTDQGKTFTGYTYPSPSTNKVIAAKTGLSGEVYELMSNGILIRTDDNGKTYVVISSNISSSSITSGNFTSVDVVPDGTLWCGVSVTLSSGLYLPALAHSTDKGKTWTFPAPIKAGNSAVSRVCGDSKGNLYCIAAGSLVAKSADGGVTWNAIYGTNGIYAINSLQINSKDQIAVASDKGLGLSNNAGASFQNISLPADLPVPLLENAMLNTQGTIFITSRTTFANHSADKASNCYYSKDNGATWQNIANVTGAVVIWLQGFDPNGYLLGRYSTATGNGICVSTSIP